MHNSNKVPLPDSLILLMMNGYLPQTSEFQFRALLFSFSKKNAQLTKLYYFTRPANALRLDIKNINR